MDPRARISAIRPPAGQAKDRAGHSIAETSLTIEGVRLVVDCGLSRRPRYEPGSGLSRLETVRVSRAAADQRRGRAGRTAPGICYRLWDAPQTASLAPFDRPEILETDLSALVCEVAGGIAICNTPLARSAPRQLSEGSTFWRLGDPEIREGSPLTAGGSELPLAPRLAHGDRAPRSARRCSRRRSPLRSEPGLGAGRETNLIHRSKFSPRPERRGRAPATPSAWARSAARAWGRRRPRRPSALAYPSAWRSSAARSESSQANGSGGRRERRRRHRAVLAVGEVQGGGPDARIHRRADRTCRIERLFASRIAPEEMLFRPGAGCVPSAPTTPLDALSRARRPSVTARRQRAAKILPMQPSKWSRLPWADDLQAGRRIAFLRGPLRHGRTCTMPLGRKTLANAAPASPVSAVSRSHARRPPQRLRRAHSLGAPGRARPPRSRRVFGALRPHRAHRLFLRRADYPHRRAEPIRPRRAPVGARRPRKNSVRAAVACGAADPGHPRFARLLARLVARRARRHARPLSQARLARRPCLRFAASRRPAPPLAPPPAPGEVDAEFSGAPRERRQPGSAGLSRKITQVGSAPSPPRAAPSPRGAAELALPQERRIVARCHADIAPPRAMKISAMSPRAGPDRQ